MVGDTHTHPRTLTVQSSCKIDIPDHLIICAANIKLVDTIGQGKAGENYGYLFKYRLHFQVNLELFTRDSLLNIWSQMLWQLRHLKVIGYT